MSKPRKHHSAERGPHGRMLFAMLAALMGTQGRPGAAAQPAVAARQIDCTSLHHKVLCGYQGWFRCPGDGTRDGWRHWSRDARQLTPASVTFELWPDMSDYGDDEKFAVPGFTDSRGRPATLFSSAHPRTVLRHFEWLAEYGIDGVFLQRFLVELDKPSTDVVLENVRSAATKTGRAYAICYDLSGAPPDTLYETLTRDWRKLVDERRVTRDDRYQRHADRPVVFVWGFFSDRFGADLAHRVIDFFHAEGPYRATLIAGCSWQWRGERDAKWRRALARCDVLSPWNVGNVSVEQGIKQAATGSWKDDLAATRKSGQQWLPVIYPGFGWTNLKGPKSADATVPRRDGEFFWQQFVTARELGAQMAYVAMFDEVDEGTAIFKVSNSPPGEAKFATHEGLPPDAYLRLTAEGARLLRGERRPGGRLPTERTDEPPSK